MFQRRGSRKISDIACIFVHAGAGYHSKDNEHLHLLACNDACTTAMAVLRNGGSAVDAVEVAIKVLEDREITNSGYGSNLGYDGVVECDALIVDHFGRSGAVGAVAQIQNPISLARVLLDHTSQPLSLRRVPPNLLVGQGATNFAYDHGLRVVPYDFLISKVARQRWIKWQSDLYKAEQDKRFHDDSPYGLSPPPSEPNYFDLRNLSEGARGAHERAMLDAVWNEAQPISPPPVYDSNELETPRSGGLASSMWSAPEASDDAVDKRTLEEHPHEYIDPFGPPGGITSMTRCSIVNNTQNATPTTSDTGVLLGESIDGELPDDSVSGRYKIDPPTEGSQWHEDIAAASRRRKSTTNPHRSVSTTQVPHDDSSSNDTVQLGEAMPQRSKTPADPTPQSSGLDGIRDDNVTDTVGAIAIDMMGNFACGASSGGIGMKHRGRIGPAALVGVGAAVIPTDPQDAARVSVATVTSGTGEHMGTTLAASTCSDRIYHSKRKVEGGHYEDCVEDEAVSSFIRRDFMCHPSVQQSTSSGAIGMLSVKKTRDGAWLYFGHNTDSFALASMHSDELKPVCTMSRSNGNGSIAQGGRAIRFRRKK